MSHSRAHVMAAAFFCTLGWVCSGPALGQEGSEYPEGAASPIGAAPADNAAAQPQTPQPQPADAGAEAQPVLDEAENVQVSDFDTVSLNVQETDLLQVLQMLSIQGQRNIVPSPKVSGVVTANLYDVTFHEALDAILQQNGAGFLEKGNFIYVYTQDELKQIEEAQRQVAHQVFRLHYITAQDALEFIKPLLSNSPETVVSISGEVGAGFQPTLGDGGANSFAHYETMIVRDYPSNLEEIAKVLQELDTPPAQVLVEATVLQAKLTDNLAFGVDISILADFGLDDILGASPLGIVDDMISGDIEGDVAETPNGAAQSTVGDVAEGDAGVKVGVLTNHVQVFVRALDQITDTTILANPKVMTLNRQRAEVLVGTKVAYLSTTTSATATTQTVEFLDTGTKLIVRPFVAPDGMIRLELHPSISNAVLRDAGGGLVLPDETTQELTTNVMVRDGQTVVLGGLFTEQTTISRNQVPGLGDIPILGNAFKGRDDTVTRDEVIFLITPHVVEDKALAAAGAAARDSVDQALLGARQGLLPWSRSKQTAAHMRDALRYMEQGNQDKALWEADLALGLDPTMLEARRLKERLTGQRVYSPSSSLLDESADVLIEQLRGQRPVPAVPVSPSPDPSELRAPATGEVQEDQAHFFDTSVQEQVAEQARRKIEQAQPKPEQQPAQQPVRKAEQPEPQPEPARIEPTAGDADAQRIEQHRSESGSLFQNVSDPQPADEPQDAAQPAAQPEQQEEQTRQQRQAPEALQRYFQELEESDDAEAAEPQASTGYQPQRSRSALQNYLQSVQEQTDGPSS